MRPLLTVAIVLAVSVPLIIYFDEIHDWITDAPTTARSAVFRGDLESLREMVAIDPSVLNYVDLSGDTLLHEAAWRDRPKVVKYLLSKGLDPTARGANQKTPLHVAARWGSLGAAKLLIEADPSLMEVRDQLGHTPLHTAVGGYSFDPICADRVAIARLLIEKEANVHALNNSGETPLHCAARSGSAEAAKLLIGAGADPAVRADEPRRQPTDSRGKSALEVAARHANVEIVELLLKHGALVVYRRYERRYGGVESALHLACDPFLGRYDDGNGNIPENFTRDLETIDLLLARLGDPNVGADVGPREPNSSLQVALKTDHPRIAHHLLENYPTLIVPLNFEAEGGPDNLLVRESKRRREIWQDAPPNTPPALANLAYAPPSEGLDAGGYITGTIWDKTCRPANYRIAIDFDGDKKSDASGRYPADNWGFRYQVQLTAGRRELWIQVVEHDVYNDERLASEWEHISFTVTSPPNEPPWSYAFHYEVEGDALDILDHLVDLTYDGSEYRVEIDEDGDGVPDRSLTPYFLPRVGENKDWGIRRDFKTSVNAPHGPEAVGVRYVELRDGKEVAKSDWVKGRKASFSIEIPDRSHPVAASRPN